MVSFHWAACASHVSILVSARLPYTDSPDVVMDDCTQHALQFIRSSLCLFDGIFHLGNIYDKVIFIRVLRCDNAYSAIPLGDQGTRLYSMPDISLSHIILIPS